MTRTPPADAATSDTPEAAEVAGVRPVAVILGLPGAGKTTVGELLADRLGVAFRDVDADIVAAEGRSIADIFATDGEPAFRAIEERAVADALTSHDGVLALGGGAVLSERTRTRLAGHTVVFLLVGTDEGVRRASLSTARPLLAGDDQRGKFEALRAARLPLYREVATLEVDTDPRTADEVVDAVVAALAANDTEPKAANDTEPKGDG